MTSVPARTAIAIVVGLLAAITAIRLVAGDDPGPLYLAPALLAGLWLGPRAGVAAAVAGALLWGATDLGGGTAGGVLMRLIVYGTAAGMVGWLAQSRDRLTGQLRRQDLQLEELRTIQEALAPAEPPERPSLELATCYIPAVHGVSGDFFLVAAAPNDATIIAVGDVAGRGLEAAKRAWHVRTLLATQAETNEDPATMLERANRSLVEDVGFASPFITVACVLFHPDGKVDWALAGHDNPLMLEDGRPLLGDGSTGLPLGVADRIGCETSTSYLSDGRGFLLYTDGLTEARRTRNGADGASELFGEDRVTELIAQLEAARPAEVVDRIQSEVSRFSGGKLADDLCLVALRAAGRPDSTEVC